MGYLASSSRYDSMVYRRCGRSGLLLPALSLGMWHNFGSEAVYSNSRSMILTAFDHGITHFDLANNYGPAAGTAEETFGRVMKADLSSYRDEIIVSTKAGYYMWPGPYGEWGSKKNLIASLDQSLRRMQLDYVDIFYHHRPDPDTPLEETAEALTQIVRSGKALYVGISNYDAEGTRKMSRLLQKENIHLLIHQMRYSLLDTSNESVLDALEEEGIGGIAFSPLAQGILTGKYLGGIPSDSRANGHSVFLTGASITEEVMDKTRRFKAIADERGQSLAEMALSWVLARKQMASVIIGARNSEQIKENLGALSCLSFSEEEERRIDEIIGGRSE